MGEPHEPAEPEPRRERMPLVHPGWVDADASDRPRLPHPAPGAAGGERRPAWLALAALGGAVLLVVGGLGYAAGSRRDQPAAPAHLTHHGPQREHGARPAPPEGPAWDAGDAQRHPAALPDPVRPAAVAGPAVQAPACDIDDLSVVNHGWDAAMGDTSTVLTATNVGRGDCLLAGWPDLRLEQGGPLPLSIETSTRLDPGGDAPPQRLLLRPGTSASAALTWAGYRSSADQRTPQRLTMRIAPAGERREIPLAERPAPFDVVAGATLQLGPWRPARPLRDD